MEPRQEESTQVTSCLKRIKPNLRSNFCSQKRSPIISRSGVSFSRSAFPFQREVSCSIFQAQTAKKKMHWTSMNSKHFHSLQKLNLALQKKEVTEMDLYYIGQTLKKPPSLQSLTLNCVDCYQLTNKAFYYLNRGLKRLPSSLKS